MLKTFISLKNLLEKDSCHYSFKILQLSHRQRVHVWNIQVKGGAAAAYGGGPHFLHSSSESIFKDLIFMVIIK
jgi:hypothetical protein